MVGENGGWDWCRIEPVLLRHTVERIATIPPPRWDAGEDRPLWRWENKRCFSTCSAYDFLSSGAVTQSDDVWKRIWKFPVPQRIRIFVWLVFHDRLLMWSYLGVILRTRICVVCVERSRRIWTMYCDHVLW
ncbi:hypothetical protein V6N13_125757 [Hibiscus sabdariffa]